MEFEKTGQFEKQIPLLRQEKGIAGILRIVYNKMGMLRKE